MVFNRPLLRIVVLLLIPGSCLTFTVTSRVGAIPDNRILTQVASSPTDLLQQAEALLQARNLEAASKVFQQAVQSTAGDGNSVLHVDALNGLGKTYLELGRFQEALPLFEKARTIAAQLKDRQGARQRGDLVGQANALNGLGFSLELLGQNAEAEAAYEKLKKLAQERGDRPWLAIALSGLGRVAGSQGNANQTIRYYEQALEYTQQLQDRKGEAVTQQALGFAYRLAGQIEQSTIAYQKALELHQSLNQSQGVAEALVGLASNDVSRKQYSSAIARYQQAVSLWQQLADRPAQAETLAELGKTYTANGQASQAIPLLQQSLVLAQELKNPQLQVNAMTHLGIAQSKAEQTAAAVTTLRAAMEILESLRAGLTDRNRVSIFERQKGVYGFLQQALVAQKQVEAALEVSERGRARAFVELLAQRGQTNSASRAAATSIGLAEIRRLAQAEQATIVEYSIVSDQLLYIWVVQPTGTIAFRQVDLSSQKLSLDEMVRRGFQSTSAEAGSAEVPSVDPNIQPIRDIYLELNGLHRVLIDPIADVLPTDANARVMLIPHQSLYLVPFAALQDNKGRYLIEKHTLAIAPAIQVLALTRQQRHSPTRDWGNTPDGVLIVGNPTMPLIRDHQGQSYQLTPLEGAKQEAEAIARFLNTQAVTGAAATKQAIVRRMGSARLIHLATHGLLDDFGTGVPGAIALAPDTLPAVAGKGILTASEILDLKLRADLIVLSACYTGRGTITSDGVIGLSRSFFTAGAASVVVSLWAVSDASTNQLMQAFYRYLQRGQTNKALALRQAILEVMKQPEFSTPYHWSAFVLIGTTE